MDNQLAQDEALLHALGVDTTPPEPKTYTAIEERILFAFGEIHDFIATHNRIPTDTKESDIFERMHAVRLKRLQNMPEYTDILQPYDTYGLLAHNIPQSPTSDNDTNIQNMDDAELLQSLGLDTNASDDNALTQLVHVGEKSILQAAEWIGKHVPCKNFERYKPMFQNIQTGLENGTYISKEVQGSMDINVGDFFIIKGQKVYIAGKQQNTTYKQADDYRLRVIYDNGTEIDTLVQSFIRLLHKDSTKNRDKARKIEPVGGLFAQESGTVYVLASKSQSPEIQQYENILHKIGVTGNDVKTRIANAKNDTTFLMDDVDIVAEYKLFQLDKHKVEKLIHTFFENAQAHITITDRFGKPTIPREWFLVPLHIIDEVIQKIQDGTIVNYRYNTQDCRIEKVSYSKK